MCFDLLCECSFHVNIINIGVYCACACVCNGLNMCFLVCSYARIGMCVIVWCELACMCVFIWKSLYVCGYV